MVGQDAHATGEGGRGGGRGMGILILLRKLMNIRMS